MTLAIFWWDPSNNCNYVKHLHSDNLNSITHVGCWTSYFLSRGYLLIIFYNGPQPSFCPMRGTPVEDHRIFPNLSLCADNDRVFIPGVYVANEGLYYGIL